MARTNTAIKTPVRHTHEGAVASRINPEQELRRSVMACMLWEDTFYEEGASIADRIKNLIPKVKPEKVALMAIEAREKMKLRHVPLLLTRELARQKFKGVADTLFQVIQRPDELTEFLSIYWLDGKQPLSSQVKKGLARAFTKFSEYQLAKYNRDEKIKLRDVLFLCHAKPIDKAQEKLWKRLVENELKIPDTWEVALSAGKDKKKTWERLIKEEKLGALALLRNLRNMHEAGVSEKVVFNALSSMNTERVLPFRFVAAARVVPQWESQIETPMLSVAESAEQLKGKTVLLVDVSGSMDDRLSSRSDMTRMDAACGLAILLREISKDVSVYSFSNELMRIPPRRGFALRDAIYSSQPHSGTYLGKAIEGITENYKRLIVITDEQSHDRIPNHSGDNGYIINVAANQNGVGYGVWNHIDGWSEAVIDYIREYEK